MNDYPTDIWGPPFWHFLHMIAMKYPENPNNTMKKKYYDFINNIPIFIPNEKMSNNFANLITEYPVSPYLDNNISLSKWMHFIHNKINELLNKPLLSYEEFINNFKSLYNQPENINIFNKNRKNIIFICTLIFILICIYFTL